MPHALPGSIPPFPIELLRELEEKVREEIDKLIERIKQEIYNQIGKLVEKIPYLTYTPPMTFEVDKEAIKQLILGYACEDPAPRIVLELKNKAIALIDRVVKPILEIQDRIRKMKDKVNEIAQEILKAEEYLQIMEDIGEAVSIAHISLAVALKVMPLQWATGGMVQALVWLADLAESVGKTLTVVGGVFGDVFGHIKGLLEQANAPIDAAIQFLDQVVPFADMIKQTIELYYLMYLQQCEGIPSDFTDSDGNINEDLLVFGYENYDAQNVNDYYNGLLDNAGNNQEFIKKVYNANLTMIGYSRMDKEKLSNLLTDTRTSEDDGTISL